jgi:hypothetical protein
MIKKTRVSKKQPVSEAKTLDFCAPSGGTIRMKVIIILLARLHRKNEERLRRKIKDYAQRWKTTLIRNLNPTGSKTNR